MSALRKRKLEEEEGMEMGTGASSPASATSAAASASASTDTPAPRKRGRPPKPKPPVDPNAPPKKRGRPPKPKPEIDPDAPPPEPKKRGRPPKPKPEIDPDAPPPEPKKRGRPPKVRPSEVVVDIPPPEPKKRGRPPKPKPEVEEPAEPKRRGRPPKAVDPDAEPSSPKKRGRPRKVVVELDTTPRKRGRPPKVRPVDAEEVDELESFESEEEAEYETPRTAPRGRGRPRLSDKLSASATKKATQRKDVLPSFDDDVFGTNSSPAAAAISRETFLKNEALRRQREARNFTFEGDANAPRQTRSGRVVADAEVDEYGGGEPETDEGTEAEVEVDAEGAEGEGDEEMGEIDGHDHEVSESEAVDDVDVNSDIEMDETPADITPLPSAAQPHVRRILETLTGREAEPAPLPDEAGNDTLQGIVSLLRGTVERGEGNSALVTGPRGAGKTRTVERALRLLPASPAPIVVRLSGLAQTDDRRAIREMGRQIALAEGKSVADDEDEDEQPGEFAPTTLPSHLLALLTVPSERAIIVVIDEFDLFTEHARQALLYCLLDVVQSVQTGPVETTARGMAVIGLTSRVDTLLLLEKRVKSRFSHRVWRVSSPLAPEGAGWCAVLRRALVPWSEEEAATHKDRDTRIWMGDWAFAVDMLLGNKQVSAALTRLTGLTTDVRILYRPFIPAMTSIAAHELDYLSVPVISAAINAQLELSGWGTGTAGVSKLRGLPHPALGVLIISKHLAYAGRTDFSLAQVEDEYLRFARTRLIGSGRTRWPLDVLRRGFDHCRTLGLLAPAGPASAGPRFAKVRATISPHEVVAFFRGEGGNILGPELGSWGKLSGGHV